MACLLRLVATCSFLLLLTIICSSVLSVATHHLSERNLATLPLPIDEEWNSLQSMICGNNSISATGGALLSALWDRTKSWRVAELALAVSRDDSPLVSVIVTAHNEEEFVSPALRSILGQSYRKLEVLFVDDASTDDTFRIASRLSLLDRRLRVLKTLVPRGTYWAKNFALLQATGEFITFQDADDVSHMDRIAAEVEVLLNNATKQAALVRYVRVASPCVLVRNRGAWSRPAYMSLMFRRKVLETVGYFDSVRYSADDEFFQRLRRTFGPASIAYVEVPYYLAALHNGSATTKSEVKLDLTQTDIALFLGEQRASYVKNYSVWHATTKDLFMPFPLLKRPFPCPASHSISMPADVTITCSIASIASRNESLRRVIRSLLPQVDFLRVYLNDYNELPAYLINPKIIVNFGATLAGDLKDNGKVFGIHQVRGYHFLCDDDIAYPANYVQQLVLRLMKYDHRVIVGVHGIVMKNEFSESIKTTYYERGARLVYHFATSLELDTVVHLLGTGTLAYHTSLLPEINYSDFLVPGMADIWFGLHAKRHKVPMIVVARPAGWLTECHHSESLYQSGRKESSVQTHVVRYAFLPFSFEEVLAGLRDILPSCVEELAALSLDRTHLNVRECL